MKEIIKLNFGLWFFAVLVSAAAWAEDGVNYPDVWERVLPEEVRTNIANYRDRGGLSQWEKENTNLADYAVSVYWRLDEAHHVDGEEYDDVILRFMDESARRDDRSQVDVLYYSYFGGRFLSKDGKHKLSLDSNIFDVLPDNRLARELSFMDKKYKFRPKQIPLSNGMIYDESYRENGYDGWSCRDPFTDIMFHEFGSYRAGVHFLPVKYEEEDTGIGNSWLLMQGLEEPRWITKKCGWGAGSLKPVDVYRYREFSFARVDDSVVSLPDGTFLFVGTKGEFPVFHIPRLRSDMSIPAIISKRYKWVRYADLFDIISLYKKGKKGALYSSRNKLCPLLQGSHPYCLKVGEDGMCSHIEGNHIYYNNLSEAPSNYDGFSTGSRTVSNACFNLALRDYIQGSYEIYHCNEGDKIVPGTIPCDERKEN